MNRLSLALAGAVFSLFAAQSMAGDAAAGKLVWEKVNCASCHGPDAKSPIDPAYPILAGQHADYIEQALHAYKKGTRQNARPKVSIALRARPMNSG